MEYAEYWQQRQAQRDRERVAAEVEIAVAEFNADHRERFYLLERMTGVSVPGGATPAQQEAHRRLFEVCNGDLHPE